MARIARRSLRIKRLPLFSLGEPWQYACDQEGYVSLRLFEPRYVELARRVLPNNGDGSFGYSETYPPKVGGSGVLARVEQFRWEPEGPPSKAAVAGGNAGGHTALIHAAASRRFRILSHREEEVVVGKPPLYVAHVQLIEDRDVARPWRRPSSAVSATDAWTYWTAPAPGQEEQRLARVQAGAPLTARQRTLVFESQDSWRASGSIEKGEGVVAAGPPSMVEGYLMVPIMPTGAVELTLFREHPPPGEAGEDIPSEQQLRAALLNMGAAPSRGGRKAGGDAAGRRKSPRARRPSSGSRGRR